MRAYIAVLALVVTACEGRLVGPVMQPPVSVTPDPEPEPVEPELPGVTPSPYTCAPEAAHQELPLRRLARTEYLNTVGAFVRAAVPTSAEAVMRTWAPRRGRRR